MKLQAMITAGACVGILAGVSPVASACCGGPPPPACYYAQAQHLPCTLATLDAYYKGNLKVFATQVGPWLGNTPATINSQFPVVINWQFQTYPAATLNTQLQLMGDLGLSRFSHHYYLASKGQISTLMMLAAQKLTAPNLVRWKAAFGQAAVDEAVTGFAPATVKAQYFAAKALPVIPVSHAWHIAKARTLTTTMSGVAGGIAAPSTNMTLYEIYDEYLWTTAETEIGALASTAWYVSKNLSIAWAIGYRIGTDFYGFAVDIDPSYGYDLVTEYGNDLTDWPGVESEVIGTGEVDWGEMVTYVGGVPAEYDIP